jgi:hypothetical protein
MPGASSQCPPGPGPGTSPPGAAGGNMILMVLALQVNEGRGAGRATRDETPSPGRCGLIDPTSVQPRKESNSNPKASSFKRVFFKSKGFFKRFFPPFFRRRDEDPQRTICKRAPFAY